MPDQRTIDGWRDYTLLLFLYNRRYLRALLTALPNAQTADVYEALVPWRIKLPSR